MNEDFIKNIPEEENAQAVPQAPENENLQPEAIPVAPDTAEETEDYIELTKEDFAEVSGADEQVREAVCENQEQPEAQQSVPEAQETVFEAPAEQAPPAIQYPENPLYSQQPYTNKNPYSQSGAYYQAPNAAPVYNSAPASQPSPTEAPSQKQKKPRKGLKIFVACIAIVLVFALGFGAASIPKLFTSTSGFPTGNSTPENTDAPELNIASPAEVEGALTTAQIASKVKPSIVGIVVYAKNTNSSAGEGTGVIMGEDKSGQYTYIVTCAHVISDAGVNVTVQTEDGTSYDAEIVGFDTRTDLGVLKIRANGMPAAEFGNSDSLKVGDSIFAIGNPGGVEFFGSFTGGYVSAIDRPVSSEIGYTMKCIQHDAAINPGNSGGALVNVYGQVVGINSQKIAATDYEGMGFAIPITSAKEIIDDLIKYNYVPDRPKLGITYYPISASAQYSMIAQIKGLPAGTLIINDISPDSSLANTKVRQYDMITAVDGKELTTPDILLEKIDKGKVGDKMTLSICRVNGDYTIQEFEVEITLVEDKGDTSYEEESTQNYIDPFNDFYNFN